MSSRRKKLLAEIKELCFEADRLQQEGYAANHVYTHLGKLIDNNLDIIVEELGG